MLILSNAAANNGTSVSPFPTLLGLIKKWAAPYPSRYFNIMVHIQNVDSQNVESQTVENKTSNDKSSTVIKRRYNKTST
jgi:hypothetical protein